MSGFVRGLGDAQVIGGALAAGFVVRRASRRLLPRAAVAAASFGSSRGSGDGAGGLWGLSRPAGQQVRAVLCSGGRPAQLPPPLPPAVALEATATAVAPAKAAVAEEEDPEAPTRRALIDWKPLPATGKGKKSKQEAPKRPWKEQPLPIQAILPKFLETLASQNTVVLQAPTGAGKTTVTPLALLESGMVDGQIIVLQPRRLTALTVARRMATLMGERVGQTIGYRIRHEHVVGNATRIEVVTEGVLVRMLHTNPTLEGIGCIFFDEFHERNIDSDVSFAMCLNTQRKFKLTTKLVVMSATFGKLADRVAELLGDAPKIISEGRTFPVDIKYSGVLDLKNYEPEGPQEFANKVAMVIAEALATTDGDALVFLPGEREIMYTWIAMNNMGYGDGQKPNNLIEWAHKLIDEEAVDLSRKVMVSPLYGTLDMQEQDEVLKPPPAGWRKVILATTIAESSLTVPGVKIVVDSGLRRCMSSDAETCISKSLTLPVSRASADQRAGRAGRVSPGICWRLWSEKQHAKLESNDETELQRADLTGVVLDLGVAGHLTNAQIMALPWVDHPPDSGLNKGRRVLTRLRAMEEKPKEGWSLTQRGTKLAQFPLHPRLSHMIYQAREVSDSFFRDACDLAAMLEEKELLKGGRVRHGVDLEARLDALQRPNLFPSVYHATRERVLLASKQLQNIAKLKRVITAREQDLAERKALSVLVAWAYPELIGTASRGGFQLENGSFGKLDNRDALNNSKHLAITTLTGPKIFWALPADPVVLSRYGIDIKDPRKHLVLGLEEEEGQSEEVEASVEEGEGAEAVAAEAGTEAEVAAPVAFDHELLAVRRYLGEEFQELDTLDGIIEAMASAPDKFEPKVLVSLLWDAARTDPISTEVVRRVFEEVVQPRFADFSGDQLCQVACAVAGTEVDSNNGLCDLAEAIAPKLDELPLDGEDGNLSALTWAMSAKGVQSEVLTERLAERAIKDLVAFEPKVLSDVREVCFWAFLRESADAWSNRERFQRMDVQFAYQGFYTKLGERVIERLADINPITCVYMMWTFSKGGVGDDALFAAIADRVGKAVQSLDRCGLTMFCWNYAFAQIENDQVYKICSKDTLRKARMAEMAPRDVSGVAWAYAKAGKIDDGKLIRGLSKHALGLLEDGIKQKCYRGPTKSLYRPVYEGDNSAVDAMVDSFDCMSLGDLLEGLVLWQHEDAELLRVAKEYVALGLRQPQKFRVNRQFVRNTGGFGRTLRGLAYYPGDHGGCREVLEAAAPLLMERMRSVRARDLVNFLFAWAMNKANEDMWLMLAFNDRIRYLLFEGKMDLEPKDVRTLKWAIAELQIGDDDVRRKLAELNAHDASPEELEEGETEGDEKGAEKEEEKEEK